MTILLIVLFGAPVIGKLPMAALVGVMMMVAITTFEWSSFRIINKMPKHDIFVGVLVALVTIVLHNLALAVLIGVIISALVFAWESAKRIRARQYIDENGIKHYEIFGPLFFGSIAAFMEKFDIKNDPDHIIIDFKESRVSDMSAIEALNNLTKKYSQVNKVVELQYLSADCRQLLQNANAVINVNIIEDPTYKVVS